MACRDDAAASTPAAQARQLLGALLQRWPHAPHRQCPAVLLCSAAGNGKSHLIERVVADMHTCTTSSASTTTTTTTAAAADVASARRRAVVVARPHVAAALTMQQRDGTTALRRVLRHAVEQACADEHNKAAAATGTTTTSRAVLVVLDHLEFFLRQHGHGGDDDDDEDDEQNESDDDDEAATGASYSGGGDCAYPRLLADLYAVLRSSPPLLGVDDAARLRVSAVVFVGMYTASNAAAPTLHLCRAAREDCFDVVLALPTPTEAERFALLCAQLCNSDSDSDSDDDKDDGESKDADSSKGSWRRWQRRRARALARALAQRAGGVTYAGLHELCDMVRAQQDEQQAARPHNNDNNNTGEDEDAAVATAVARRVMRAFYGSDSVAAAAQRRSVGYVDVQEVHWRDIAGMRATKALLRRLITTPLRRRALYARCGVRPSSGVLLHGPPGTGKTMLAKAMATELNASFVYVDLPTLLRGEVGESERTLSELFASARARSPAVVFMDELQAAFGVRYARASSAHDTRLVTHLLSLLDEAHEDDAHVLLFVGATNVPQLLDPLVLRPGRLDTHVHVALPGREARAQLMRGIVCGEWATWFAHDNDNDGGERTPTLDDAHTAQAWLIDTFVQHSDGLSGAALRNVAALFALQLVRVVAQQQQQLVDTRASATPVRTTHAATVARVRRALRNAFAAHAAASSTSSSSNTDDAVEAAVHGDVVVQVLQSVLHKYT